MPTMNMIQALNDAHKVKMRADDDILITRHHYLVRVVQSLDHVEGGHQSRPSLSASSRCSARCQGKSA